ncbi:MAG TPA: hypothetical protein VLD37_03560 [Candidatus Bilamarchaeum sp.]|nr:hypothetical protein [Candidatus Bilamarchaeum sp.]
MRGFSDLAAEMRGNGHARKTPPWTLDRKELSRASLPHLCPGAFDGFLADPEPPAGPGRPKEAQAAAAALR